MSNNVTGADNQQGSPLSVLYGYDPSETTRRISHINESLAILLGLLFTDGCVSPKNKNSWRIYFAVKSKLLVELFSRAMIDTFGISREQIRFDTTQDGLMRAIVNSRIIGDFLTNMFGTFRTLSYQDGTTTKAKLPVESLISSGNVRAFLRAAFSCDGGLAFYPAHRDGSQGGTTWLIRTIFIACGHQQLRTDYLTLLNNLGIKAREVPQDGKIKIETRTDIEKFYKYIGFVQGVEVTANSKYWIGCCKQDVLKEMVLSYDNPSLIYNHIRFKVR